MMPSAPKPRFIASTLSLGAFSLASMVMGLAGTVIITRQFSTEDFGAYVLVVVLAAFLSQMSTFGLESAVSRFIVGAADEDNRERFFSTAVLVRIGAIVLAGLLAGYVGPASSVLFGQSLLPGFVLYVPLLFAVESFRSLLKATLQGCLLFGRLGVTNLTASFMFLVLAIAVCAAKGDISLLILARIASSLLAAVLAFVLIPIKKRLLFHTSAFVELMKFGYPLYFDDILGFVYSRIDTVAVALFLGPAEIAIYEVARKISRLP